MNETTEIEVGDFVEIIESINGYTRGSIFKVLYASTSCVQLSELGWRYKIQVKLVSKHLETFDFLKALKYLSEGKTVYVQYSPESEWVLVDTTNNFSIFLNAKYSLDGKVKENTGWHWLIKSKGKVSVTRKKYVSEQGVIKGYSYPVKVIQKIENDE